MSNYTKEENSGFGFELGIIEIISAIGFFILMASVFMQFVPINEQSWSQLGRGNAVAFFALVGGIAVFFRHYFGAFFAGMFSFFFLTHEIIIEYDKKAIAAQQEVTSGGLYRLVFSIYSDALSIKTGAFWGFCGVVIALLACIAGWIIYSLNENKKLMQAALEQQEAEAIEEEQEEVLEEEIEDDDSEDDDSEEYLDQNELPEEKKLSES